MIPPAELERLRRLREDGAITEEDHQLILRQLAEQDAADAAAEIAAAEAGMEVPYAGFVIRLGAWLLDALFAFTFLRLVVLNGHHERLYSLYILLPNFLFIFLYNVWLVKRYGGTPGKLLLRIGIVRLDGSPVGWREAFLRELPDLGFFLVLYFAGNWALWQLTDPAYHALLALPVAERTRQLATLEPLWLPSVQNLYVVWILSEFIILLTNEKRRALQDYLAGTVVIHLPPGKSRFLPFLN